MATERPRFDWNRFNSDMKERGYIGTNPQHILQEIDPKRIPKADVVVPFIKEALPQAAEMLQTAKPHSLQEYLGFAMLWGVEALSQGNYGIGAVYVLTHGGEEWIIAGRNGLVTDGDTSKHAEMDVIDAVESVARGERDYIDRVILRRKALDNESRKILVTSLDPCPMCRVRCHNHGVCRIMVGSADPPAGSFVGPNVEMMPPLWKIIMEAQGTQVDLAGIITDPDDTHYINPKYLPLITQMFELNRAEIDKALKEGELNDVTAIATIAQGLRSLFPIEEGQVISRSLESDQAYRDASFQGPI